MLPPWKKLYEELTTALREVEQASLSLSKKTEESYYLAVEFWLKLKEAYLAETVQEPGDEICFFKKTKPRFTAYIEYFMLCNQALLFIPKEQEAQLEHWREQAKRYHRFRERHESFIHDYENCVTGHDAVWYRRDTTLLQPQERIYEDYDCRSSHDHLVRGLLAHRLYHDFVQQQLNQLAHDDTPQS